MIKSRPLVTVMATTVVLCLCVCISPLPAAVQERILNFDSRIRVQSNGDLTVTETIQVQSTGKKIRHGIYRDFPLRYIDRRGLSHRVGFELLTVQRDGRREPLHTKQLSNGIRIYMGSKNHTLRPGVYTYRLTYRTSRQIGFFDSYDELYWNVTGTDWNFVIDRARAVIELPAGGEILQQTAYTGHQGQKGRDFVTRMDETGNPVFVTTRALRPREGLTIAVTWPNGLVVEPTSAQKIGFIVKDNLSAFLALAGLVLVLGYYALAWIFVGRNPDEGTIIPLFVPPEGFSPAATRFVRRMGFDHKVFAAAIVNLAVKGAIRIEEDENGVFNLDKITETKPQNLSRGERKILDKLFGFHDRIQLQNKNHQKIQNAIKALKQWLNTDFEKIYFHYNSRYLIPAGIVTIATLAAVVLTADDKSEALFMGIWLTIWTMGCTMLTLKVIAAWRGTGGSGLQQVLPRFGALGITLFALPFYAGEIFGMVTFAKAVSVPAMIGLLLLVMVNIVFYHLIKAPTLKGRRVMDQIEGFRKYLSVAEKDRLNILNPPEKTPTLFEKYLPYALSLDVENQWSEQFTRELAISGQQTGYQPSWYSGSRFSSSGLPGFTSGLGGAFTGAIAAASTAPGSSSGSGGGGSSGGGGGGGGGGGW